MLLRDNDSIIYEIETKNVYEDLEEELFDFSNYPKDSKYFHGANSLVVGKIKDETSGVAIKGFVGLKSRMDTFITEDSHESKKTRGIIKNIVDDEL